MIKPFGQRCLVRQEEAPKQKGKIIIPDQASKKPLRGTVTKSNINGIVSGSVIYYAAYSGIEIESGNEVLLAIKDEDIIAVE